jgi:hypothetical protein
LSRRTVWSGPTLLVVILCVGVVPTLSAKGASAATLPERIVHYQIDARLDPVTRKVQGKAEITWRNRTTHPADDLCLHLYLNAFDNNRTTFMRARPDQVERWSTRYPGEWGGIDLTSLRIGEEDVTSRLEVVTPDDDNKYDRTVARLPLAKPVAVGSETTLAIDFVARLPRLFARSGHAAPFFFVAQWFPKLGVFQDGKWNCHQYHDTTEFFADFGVYDVRITVPADFVVGHTGVATAERRNDDGTKSVEVHAEDVHDFAWTADPRFHAVDERVGDVPVRLLIQPHHEAQGRRYVRALRAAMQRYEEWFGPYPYPTLTVVDPPRGAAAAGGMEYPMLITVGTAWWLPESVRLPEVLTIHELGHQYWYGLVASDEVGHPWLDEGINSYVEGLIMDDVYGPGGSYLDFLGLRADATAEARFRYLAAPSLDPITTAAHEMLDPRSYVSTTYAKTALVLRTLARSLGGDRLREALRDYFQTWRFRHPSGKDFRASIEASTGKDLGRYFDQTLDGTGVLDYAVSKLDVREVPPLSGRGVDSDRVAVDIPRYRVEVIVERRGDVRMPVDIVVTFEGGSETRESWDGEERWYRLEIVSTEQADYAVVDPDNKLPLDVDRLNNSRMHIAGTRGVIRLASRWGMWLQGFLHLVTGL